MDFTGSATGENDITPEEYCTTMIDSGQGELFNPCRWTPDGSDKGGTCSSICSEFTPTESEENAISSHEELLIYKDQCISNQWHPEVEPLE